MTNGESVSSYPWRWSNDTFTTAGNAVAGLPLGDRKANELFVLAMEEYLKELPNISIAQARKLVPFDQTYWTNWPTDKNK